MQKSVCLGSSKLLCLFAVKPSVTCLRVKRAIQIHLDLRNYLQNINMLPPQHLSKIKFPTECLGPAEPTGTTVCTNLTFTKVHQLVENRKEVDMHCEGEVIHTTTQRCIGLKQTLQCHTPRIPMHPMFKCNILCRWVWREKAPFSVSPTSFARSWAFTGAERWVKIDVLLSRLLSWAVRRTSYRKRYLAPWGYQWYFLIIIPC